MAQLSRGKIFIIVLLASLAVATLAGVLFQSWYVIDLKRVPIEITVTNDSLIGFNTGTDKLYFGTLAPLGFGERKASLISAYDSIVVIKVTGQVERWVSVSENNIRLTAGHGKEVVFRLSVPPNTTAGNYSGIAVIQYHRVLPWQ